MEQSATLASVTVSTTAEQRARRKASPDSRSFVVAVPRSLALGNR